MIAEAPEQQALSLRHGQPIDYWELERHRLHNLANSMTLAIAEGFGDMIDTRTWMYDDPSFGFGRAGQPIYATSLNDRDDGRYLPIFQSQYDLQIIRAQARNVTAMSGNVMGAIGTLSNYTLGAGLKCTVQRAASCPAGISDEAIQVWIREAQSIIDLFMVQNKWQSNKDRELDWRSREDGEAFLELSVSPGGQIRARFDEPDMICQPSNPSAIEEWLIEEDYARYSPDFIWSWSFGIHNIRRTPDDPAGYHVVYDATGQDWDYVPERRMVHVKSNVPCNVKRGVSDLYWIANDVQSEMKLRRNMADASALQSAIAWIRQHAKGTTAQAVNSMVTGQTVAGMPQRPNGTVPRKGKLNSGTVIDIPEGQEYLPGPMGAERNPNFILVAQYVGRAIATRWTMPEFMFTSDASNNNMASSIVAESPFVKAREADQRFYGEVHIELFWKVLRLAHECGRFARNIQKFEDLLLILKITAKGPRVATRDEYQTVQRQQIEIAMGTLSRKTAAAEMDRDLAEEEEQGAAPQATPGNPAPANMDPTSQPMATAPGGEQIGLNMVQIRRINALTDQIVAGYRAGTIDDKTARMRLDALGIPANKVDLYLDADPTNDPVSEPVAEGAIDVSVKKRASSDFPKDVPTQEQILNGALEEIDTLLDRLATATIRKAPKSELRAILEQIEDVKNQAATAAQVCGMLTPFKPNLQDGKSADQAPIDPLAVAVTTPKE